MHLQLGNAQHIGKRQEQQDAFAFSPSDDAEFVLRRGTLAILADGMGGMANGGDASRTAVKVFLRTYIDSPNDSIQELLHEALTAANDSVLALAKELDLAEDTGSTSALRWYAWQE